MPLVESYFTSSMQSNFQTIDFPPMTPPDWKGGTEPSRNLNAIFRKASDSDFLPLTRHPRPPFWRASASACRRWPPRLSDRRPRPATRHPHTRPNGGICGFRIADCGLECKSNGNHECGVIQETNQVYALRVIHVVEPEVPPSVATERKIPAGGMQTKKGRLVGHLSCQRVRQYFVPEGNGRLCFVRAGPVAGGQAATGDSSAVRAR